MKPPATDIRTSTPRAREAPSPRLVWGITGGLLALTFLLFFGSLLPARERLRRGAAANRALAEEVLALRQEIQELRAWVVDLEEDPLTWEALLRARGARRPGEILLDP